MKHYTLLSLAALLACHAPVNGQPAPPDPYKSIQTKIREKKYPEAVVEAEQVLQDANLSVNDKIRFLKIAAQASMSVGRNEIPAAMAFHERIVADPAIPNNAKIEAIQSISNSYIRTLDGQELGRMDLLKAHAILNRGLELPNLTVDERALALKNIGLLFAREDNQAKAREFYQQIIDSQAGDRAKNEAQRLIADSYLNEGQSEKALEIYRRNDWALDPIYRRLGESEKLLEESFKALDDQKIAEGNRWTTFTRLPLWDAREKDMPAIRKAWDSYTPEFFTKDPKRPLFLQRAVINRDADPQFVEWAAPLLLKVEGVSANDKMALRSSLMEALAVQGKTQALELAASALVTDEQATAPSRFWGRLVAAAAKTDGRANFQKIVQDEKALTNQEKAEALLRAARTVLKSGNEQGAHALFAQYSMLLAHPARAAITCEFTAESPYDVGSWLDSSLLKNAKSQAKLDRPYGDNLEFLLLTDSAVMGRNTTAGGKEASGDNQTDFHIACDANGIHFFFNAHDSRVAEVVAGLVGGGSFEMYLAPGEHQAYYTFLTDMPRGGIDPEAFLTMYPNPQFRIPSLKDGSLRTDTRATDKGFATHFFLAWELFYDKLPANGTKWQFDAIRWTRAGGFSFGGSESVHNRSGWGDIVFSGLTDENLNAIKRGIVFKAVAKYNRDKRPVGVVGGWADPVLADPAFYAAKVEPYLNNLNRYAAMVNKDMSVAEVDKLFQEAVPEWMEAEYRIAAMRTQYLQHKQLAGMGN